MLKGGLLSWSGAQLCAKQSNCLPIISLLMNLNNIHHLKCPARGTSWNPQLLRWHAKDLVCTHQASA